MFVKVFYYLRSFQHTPRTYPRPPTNSFCRSSFWWFGDAFSWVLKKHVILVVTTHCMPMVVTLNDLQKTSPLTAPGPLAEQTPKARIASYGVKKGKLRVSKWDGMKYSRSSWSVIHTCIYTYILCRHLGFT